jgi:hypothetical protein
MKLVTTHVQSSKHLPYDLVLPPGTRVSDIRTHLTLDDAYALASADDPTKPLIPGERSW